VRKMSSYTLPGTYAEGAHRAKKTIKEAELWKYQVPMVTLEIDKIGLVNQPPPPPFVNKTSELKNRIEETKLKKELLLEEKKLAEIESGMIPEQNNPDVMKGAGELLKGAGELIKSQSEIVKTQAEIMRAGSEPKKEDVAEKEAEKKSTQILGEIAQDLIQDKLQSSQTPSQEPVLATVTSEAIKTLGDLARGGKTTDGGFLDKYIDTKMENISHRIISEIKNLLPQQRSLSEEIKELKELGFLPVGGDATRYAELQKDILQMRKELKESDRKWDYLMQKLSWDKRKELMEYRERMKDRRSLYKFIDELADSAVSAVVEEQKPVSEKFSVDIKKFKCDCGNIVNYLPETLRVTCLHCGKQYETVGLKQEDTKKT